jgi:hypothetical protein
VVFVRPEVVFVLPEVVFVLPEVAVRVRYLGWEAGRLRHPAYRGVA